MSHNSKHLYTNYVLASCQMIKQLLGFETIFENTYVKYNIHGLFSLRATNAPNKYWLSNQLAAACSALQE